MASELTRPDICQVDFYLLAEASLRADTFACRLAMMAWERKQRTFIVAATSNAVEELDKLMWQFPQGRFLPHAASDDPNSDRAPVNIGTLSNLNPTDVVINLCPEAVPQPERFSRVLEIVPFANNERKASRVKYKTYKILGLEPRTHEISK